MGDGTVWAELGQQMRAQTPQGAMEPCAAARAAMRASSLRARAVRADACVVCCCSGVCACRHQLVAQVVVACFAIHVVLDVPRRDADASTAGDAHAAPVEPLWGASD